VSPGVRATVLSHKILLSILQLSQQTERTCSKRVKRNGFCFSLRFRAVTLGWSCWGAVQSVLHSGHSILSLTNLHLLSSFPASGRPALIPHWLLFVGGFACWCEFSHAPDFQLLEEMESLQCQNVVASGGEMQNWGRVVRTQEGSLI